MADAALWYSKTIVLVKALGQNASLWLGKKSSLKELEILITTILRRGQTRHNELGKY